MIELLEQLVAIERLAVTTFEVPMSIPRDDKAAIRTVYVLLTGGTAELDATMTAKFTADDTPQIRELADTNGLFRGTGLVEDYQVDILGQGIQVGPITVETPPLQVMEAHPADDGLELTARTAPNHAGQPARLTRYNPADQQFTSLDSDGNDAPPQSI